MQNELIGQEREHRADAMEPIPDWLLSEREAHESFAATRRHMYVKQSAALATLQGYVEEEHSIVGSGIHVMMNESFRCLLPANLGRERVP